MGKPLSAKHVAQMVDIHGSSFSPAWTAADFKTHLEMPSDDVLGVESAGSLQGFVVTRMAVDQAEILTIVTAPMHKKSGVGTRLMMAIETHLQARGAEIVFLEVAIDNVAAIKLYEKHGYHQCGKRPGYYRRDVEGIIGRVDAIIFQKHLTGRRI